MLWLGRVIDALRGDHADRLTRHIDLIEQRHEEMKNDLRQAHRQVDVLRELVTGMRGGRDVR